MTELSRFMTSYVNYSHLAKHKTLYYTKLLEVSLEAIDN